MEPYPRGSISDIVRLMRDFRRLRAWQSAQTFIENVYAASATFPPDERFGLTQQLRRAAVSIASNIAEGCGRDTDADLARFLSIAAGSTSECESQIATASNLGFVEEREAVRLMDQAEHIRRQLHKLTLAVRTTGN